MEGRIEPWQLRKRQKRKRSKKLQGKNRRGRRRASPKVFSAMSCSASSAECAFLLIHERELFSGRSVERDDAVLKPAQLAFACIVAACGVLQMRAQLAVHVFKPFQLDLQRLDLAQDGLGALAHAHSVHAQHDGLLIGVKRGGRDRLHALLRTIGVEVVAVLVADDGLVVDVLRRNIHQSERQRAFRWPDVFAGDLIDALADVFQELASRDLSVGVILSVKGTAEVLQRKLRVDGYFSLRQVEHSVGNVAGAEAVLHIILLAREYLRKQILELQLSKPATQFGSAQHALKVAQAF